MSKDLDNVDPRASVNVIVRFRQPLGARITTRSSAISVALSRSSLGSIQGGAYAIPGSAIQNLALNPEVLSIAPDRPVHMLLDNTTAAVNAPPPGMPDSMDPVSV